MVCLALMSFPRKLAVKIQVEFKYIDARLAEEPELAPLRMRSNQCKHLGLTHSAFTGDAWYLESRAFGRNVRIES